MTLGKISGKAFRLILENAGINPKWVTEFHYTASNRPIVTLNMIAVLDDVIQTVETPDGLEISTVMVDLPVCNCDGGISTPEEVIAACGAYVEGYINQIRHAAEKEFERTSRMATRADSGGFANG